MSKIAIMGSAPSSRNAAPFQDLNWEIWACSPPNYDLPRVDAWFELHNLDRKFVGKNKPWIDVLTNHPRVYVAQKDARLPQAEVYPWEQMLAKHGPYWFTSSIAWMMAYAIEQKPDKIGLWGVDMAAQDEYSFQRPGCWRFMEKAEEAGIQVCIPPQSDLLAPVPVYGIREFWPQWSKHKARRQELKERLHTAETAMENAERDAFMLRGALDDMQYHENTWVQPSPDYRGFYQPDDTEEFVAHVIGGDDASVPTE